MEEILLMNVSTNPSEIAFFALIFVPILLVLLAELFYIKKAKKNDDFFIENLTEYSDFPIDSKEAEKVSQKLKENSVVLGVKKPKNFKTKRKPQNTKVLAPKSIKKPRNDYLADLVEKK
jgi:hypothetical protein